MIGALIFLVIGLFVPTYEQSTPISPCPGVFNYEPAGTEQGRWYGVVNLSTDSTLHSLWMNIILDSKADILGNWIGDVTTTDNIDFKVENTKMKISPGPAVAVRFFVQYNVLNKVPRLQAIRLNGREICNSNNPLPTVERPDLIQPVRQDTRPTVVRPVDSFTAKPVIVERPQDTIQSKPVYGKPSGNGPVFVPTRPSEPGNANPYKIDGQNPVQSVTQRRTTPPSYQVTVRPYATVQQDDDDDDSSPNPDDYWSPKDISSLLINGSVNSKRQPEQCGTVTRNNPNLLVVNGKPTLEGQWPWQVALYQILSVDSKYICGGTLVSHRHVITAAHCVTRKSSSKPVNKNTLQIYLGKHNLRTSVEGVEVRFVSDIVVYPDYNKTPFARDVSILRMAKQVEYTDFVRAACLWPENQIALSNVIGKKGSVVGWGFDETGVATEELSLVEMPVVDQETCIRSYSAFFDKFTDKDFTFCAGYRDGTSVCNGDSGGGMVFRIQGVWYLRGLVSLSVARLNEYRCDPNHYVVFTDLAKFLPWIRSYISD